MGPGKGPPFTGKSPVLVLSLRQAGLGRERGTASDGREPGPPAGVGLESGAVSAVLSVPTSAQEA